MSGNQKNFRRNNNNNGAGNGGGQKRFGRGNSYGGNNRNANDHRKRGGGYQRYGNWADNNRPFNSKNNNNELGASTPFHQNDEGFSKFRDLEHQAQEQQRQQNMRQRRNSTNNRGKGRNDWHVGGGNTRDDTYNRYGEQRAEQDGCDKSANAEQVTPMTAAPAATTPTPLMAVPIFSSTPSLPPETKSTLANTQNVLEDKKPLLSKIKLEKMEHKETKQPTKQPPSPSSTSSSSNSTENTETATTEILKTNNAKTIARNKMPVTNSVAKSNQNNAEEESSSSNSSSSEEESSEEEEPAYKTPQKSKVNKEAARKMKPVKRKQSSEEDLVCLGKLEKKFVIEDDEFDRAPVQNKQVSKTVCLICDKQGHSAFECQMICKNCATPYHNLKSCPQPANLTVMMQYFMEFCMTQMSQFNPEQRFLYSQNLCLNENSGNFSTNSSNALGRKLRDIGQSKSNDSTKTINKRKRKRATDDDEEEEEEEEEEEDVTAEETTATESQSESDSSEPMPVASKKKNKRTKTAKVNEAKEQRSTFPLSQFPTFPTFGAAAAAYNPLIFGQLMQSAFPAASNIKFK